MKQYWNHNRAYDKWIKKQVKDCYSILDVGCGDGTLFCYLDDKNHELTGIDLHDGSLLDNKLNIHYLKGDFLKLDLSQKYDAIIFVASIHHLDMIEAIKKAKSLLNENGKLIIVGLGKSDTLFDLLLDILRLIPSKIITLIRHEKSSEDLNISVSYDFFKMSEIRKILKTYLKGAKISYGLHYRYLVIWRK